MALNIFVHVLVNCGGFHCFSDLCFYFCLIRPILRGQRPCLRLRAQQSSQPAHLNTRYLFTTHTRPGERTGHRRTEATSVSSPSTRRHGECCRAACHRQQITSLVTGQLTDGAGDALFVGSSTDMLAYDVDANKDLFFKDVRHSCHRHAPLIDSGRYSCQTGRNRWRWVAWAASPSLWCCAAGTARSRASMRAAMTSTGLYVVQPAPLLGYPSQ